jgi:Icc-related predicted phosphoesterase
LPKTRVFYATDIHGSERCFTKFINAGSFYKADVLIVGGDITGKYFIPIVQQLDGSFTATFLGKDYLLKLGKEIDDLEQRIRAVGYYAYRTNPKEVEELKSDNAKRDQIFETLITDSMKRLLAYAEQKLKGTKIKCFVSPGNDDSFFVDKVLAESSTVIYPEGRVIEIDSSHEMASTGYTNMTPWNCPRDITEEELMKRIEDMTTQLKNPARSIFNFHCPPFGTTLDEAPQLDEKLQPKLSASGPLMAPVGSTSVRAAIEKYQPLLGLHGHIHESKGYFRIGRTICVNPGSEYTEGVLRGFLAELTEDKVKDFLFVSA